MPISEKQKKILYRWYDEWPFSWRHENDSGGPAETHRFQSLAYPTETILS